MCSKKTVYSVRIHVQIHLQIHEFKNKYVYTF